MLQNSCVIILHFKKNYSILKNTPYYLTDVAGVPLIIRSLLALQKCGIKKVFLFYDEFNQTVHETVKREKRLFTEIKWESLNENSFIEYVNKKITAPFLLMGDALVFDHSQLTRILPSLQDKSSAADDISVLSPEGVFFVPNKNILHTYDPKISPALFFDALLNEKKKKIDRPLFAKHITDMNSIKRAQNFIISSIKSPSYGLIEKYFDRKISTFITRLLLQTPITPNHITFFSTLIGLLSVVFFLAGDKTNAIIGSVLFIVSTIVDCCDGEVARIKFLESKFGSLLDIICDNLVQIPLFFSIAYGFSLTHHAPSIITVGSFAVLGSTLSFLLIFSNMIIQEKRSDLSDNNSLTPIEKREYNLGKHIDNLINRDFSYIILLCAILDLLDWFLLMTAIGSNLLWITIVIKKRKIFFYTLNPQKDAQKM